MLLPNMYVFRAWQINRSEFTVTCWLEPLFPCILGPISYYRSVEWLRLEGTFKDHPVPIPCCGLGAPHQVRLSKATSNLALDTSRDGASTTSLGSQCQDLAALGVENFLLTSNLNLLSFSFKPLCLVLPLSDHVKSQYQTPITVTIQYIFWCIGSGWTASGLLIIPNTRQN